jgi:hypothetical protein
MRDIRDMITRSRARSPSPSARRQARRYARARVRLRANTVAAVRSLVAGARALIVVQEFQPTFRPLHDGHVGSRTNAEPTAVIKRRGSSDSMGAQITFAPETTFVSLVRPFLERAPR